MVLDFIQDSILLFISFGLISSMLIVAEYSRFKNRVNSIAPAEAVTLMNREEAVLIDARPQNDFKKSHITGAINISANEIENQLPRLKAYKKRPIITYCQAGLISGSVAKGLKINGFTNIYSLKGGILGWEAMNLPTESKKDKK